MDLLIKNGTIVTATEMYKADIAVDKEKIVNILYSIYAFLFIFTMINKEFLLFGIDLRFILLPIGAILIILSFTEKNKKIEDYDDKIGRL